MPDWMMQVALAAAPIMSALTLAVIGRFHYLRTQLWIQVIGRLDGIDDRLQHQDECIDGMKEKIAVAVSHESRINRLEDRIIRGGEWRADRHGEVP